MGLICCLYSAEANADYASSACALLRRDKQSALRVSGWRESPAAWLTLLVGGYAHEN